MKEQTHTHGLSCLPGCPAPRRPQHLDDEERDAGDLGPSSEEEDEMDVDEVCGNLFQVFLLSFAATCATSSPKLILPFPPPPYSSSVVSSAARAAMPQGHQRTGRALSTTKP